MISLIANSGIQFHKFEIEIDPNADVTKTMGFIESFASTESRISLGSAYYLPDQDFWVAKDVLKYLGYLDEDDNLLFESINLNEIKGHRLSDDGLQKTGDAYFQSFGDVLDALEAYGSTDDEVTWIPIPYFKKTGNKVNFGPLAWARAMFRNISQKQDKIKKFQVVLIFDTKIDNKASKYYTPRGNDTYNNDNFFILSKDTNFNLQFCDLKYDCEWVDSYLKSIYYKKQGMNGEINDFPYYRHNVVYQYLIKYLAEGNFFPQVILYSDDQAPIEVDLVLDIGNANTCGVLFESPQKNNDSFKFTSVKKLCINDLTQPWKEYNDPFSMRLVFAKAEFGEEISPSNYKSLFNWPSFVRLGKEATKLISKHNIDTKGGRETFTHHSSPKRYLWDNKKSDNPWEFVSTIGQKFKTSIGVEGISEQFKTNGDFAYDGFYDATPHYSKKSLMTFVYVEILLHALSQINSFEFRRIHGNLEKPRKLKRITITCPTSIIQHEQIILRKCAQEASVTLKRYFENNFIGEYDQDNDDKFIEIIPSPKDLAKKLSMAREKKDWIYDEATCGQLVFLYAEIAERYLGNVKLFFDIYGKRRDDVTDIQKKSLTIGSIDIGGGTTDLMICAYQYEDGQSLAVLKPHPLYWESFNLAGDDLLKDIVKQVILEGKENDENDKGCVGVIQNQAKAKGVSDPSEKLLSFFGTDANPMDYITRIFRKNFIVQVAVPIANYYLQHASDDNSEDREVTFDEIFHENKPNQEVIDFFDKKFSPLKFKDINWKLSKNKIFEIVEKTFNGMLKQLSTIMSAYGCDFVILAGKPTNLSKIREMFIKYYTVSPDRIITLNNYRVGRWYPFANNLGYFENTKSIVAVGACIALMGGVIDKLAGFRLNTELLKRNLISTSDYMGTIDKSTEKVSTIYFTPDDNKCDIEAHSLPILFGYKQLINKNYPAKAIYKLEFNNKFFEEKALEQDSSLLDDDKKLQNAIETQKRNLKNRMPFQLQLKRTWSESKEEISIERIRDSSKNEISKKTLSLAVMTLLEESGYWLDTGEFILNIK